MTERYRRFHISELLIVYVAFVWNSENSEQRWIVKHETSKVRVLKYCFLKLKTAQKQDNKMASIHVLYQNNLLLGHSNTPSIVGDLHNFWTTDIIKAESNKEILHCLRYTMNEPRYLTKYDSNT